MQKATIVSIVASVALLAGTAYIVSDRPVSKDSAGLQSQNVEVREGIQYVSITARGGYSPRVTEIKAGLPTKLVVKTDGTYDCSSALVVRSVGFKKLLQPTGEEIIDLGTSQSGDKVQGVCSMGMYNFVINAN